MCKESCDLLRTDLQTWTQDSAGRGLSLHGGANEGFFNQDRITWMSKQIHCFESTTSLVASVATLYVNSKASFAMGS